MLVNMIILFIFLLSGILLGLSTKFSRKRKEMQTEWRPVKAVVTNVKELSSSQSSSSYGNPDRLYRIEVEYVVGTTKYTGRTSTLAKKGDIVDILYNPKKPEQHGELRTSNISILVLNSLGILFGFSGILIAIFRFVLRIV